MDTPSPQRARKWQNRVESLIAEQDYDTARRQLHAMMNWEGEEIAKYVEWAEKRFAEVNQLRAEQQAGSEETSKVDLAALFQRGKQWISAKTEQRDRGEYVKLLVVGLLTASISFVAMFLYLKTASLDVIIELTDSVKAPGLAVLIDEDKIVSQELESLTLKPGQHTLTIQENGEATHNFTFEVVPGKKNQVVVAIDQDQHKNNNIAANQTPPGNSQQLATNQPPLVNPQQPVNNQPQVTTPQQPVTTHPQSAAPQQLEKVLAQFGSGSTAGDLWEGNSLQAKFRWCPPGTFMMGEPPDKTKPGSKGNQVEVTLTKGFWMAQYEVTQKTWQQVMKTTPWKDLLGEVAWGDNSPVSFITWELATDFCRTLTEQERTAGRLPVGWEYMLPSEAEWEYACRAGTTTEFSYGDDPNFARLNEYAWNVDNARRRGMNYGQPVGQLKPNPWNLYDIHGNLYEWCRGYASKRPQGGTDPEVTLGSARIFKGGCSGAAEQTCRSAYRESRGVGYHSGGVGFRIALVQTGTANVPTTVAQQPGDQLSAKITVVDSDGTSPLTSDHGWVQKPAWLEGASFHLRKKPGTISSRELAFTTETAGIVVVLVSYQYDGNSSGGWHETRTTLEQFQKEGWHQVGEVVGENAKRQTRLFQIITKLLPANSKVQFHTLKYNAPVALSVEAKQIEGMLKSLDPEHQLVQESSGTPSSKNVVAQFGTGSNAGDLWEGNSLGMKLRWCPPGDYKMGSPADEKDRHNTNEDQVQVTLTKGFWIGQYELTQKEWLQVMETSPWKDAPENSEKHSFKIGQKFPAIYVSWADATAFCKQLTERERQAKQLPQGWEYQLPTEAQWEYACRAGTTTRFSFGADPDYKQLSEYAWWKENTVKQDPQAEPWAHEVGLKKPNPWNLYDVHGNVAEWCQDAWTEQRPGGDDPAHLGGGDKVYHGGCWRYEGKDLRSADRYRNATSAQTDYYGFRVALVQTGEAAQIANLPTTPLTPETTEKPETPDTPVVKFRGNFRPGRKPGAVWKGTDLKMSFAWCPEGKFKMGSPENEFGRNDDEEQVDVTLTKGFYMSQIELTQAQYAAVMRQVPWANTKWVAKGPNFPAVMVSWRDALEFCEKLTKAEHAAGKLPADWKYSLPTEAQWEYACRAETTTAYAHGDDLTLAQISQFAWAQGVPAAIQNGAAQLPGSKRPNAWNLYDMHGNVFEWVLDSYREKLPGGVDPVVSEESKLGKVFRSGSYRTHPTQIRSASRISKGPDYRQNVFGFRVAIVQVD